MTWQVEMDYLHCSPNFFGKPCYDYAIVDTIKNGIFACILYIFSIWIDDKPYSIALIQAFDVYTGPIWHKDEELGLWHIGMKPRILSEFVFIGSIIQGSVLVQDFEDGRESEYIVMDLIDGDMFLWVKEMQNCSLDRIQ